MLFTHRPMMNDYSLRDLMDRRELNPGARLELTFHRHQFVSVQRI